MVRVKYFNNALQFSPVLRLFWTEYPAYSSGLRLARRVYPPPLLLPPKALSLTALARTFGRGCCRESSVSLRAKSAKCRMEIETGKLTSWKKLAAFDSYGKPSEIG